MLALVIAVIFGLGIGYFATQNVTPITIQFADYVVEGVPLYAVILGSLLVGLFMAYLLYLGRTVSSKLTMHGENHADGRVRQAVANLEQRVGQLESENARLRMGQSSALEYPKDHLQRAS
jgi:uncharacterized integral membrane protein